MINREGSNDGSRIVDLGGGLSAWNHLLLAASTPTEMTLIGRKVRKPDR